MTDTLRALLEARSTLLADLEPVSNEMLLVRSDRSGTMQLYELEPVSGNLRQLTDLPDPVARAAYVAGKRVAVIEVDQDGDELHQLFLLELDEVRNGGARSREELRALTNDTRFGHHLAGVALDGSALAFTSNRRNGVDFDLWAHDFASGHQRLVYAEGGWCQPASGFSPDGRWVSILRPGARPLDTDLLLVELASGSARTLVPHPDEAAQVGPPAWVGPGQLWASSNVGRDFAAVVSLDLGASRAPRVVAEDPSGDLEVFASRGGTAVALVANRDGVSKITVLDLGGTRPVVKNTPATKVELPEPGVVHDYRRQR
ncbi:MAG: hypothetical protein M1435_00295, partial [Actinobacteria bacterium]|nr:hypothetical protein [Actinomycetota bacterium]